MRETSANEPPKTHRNQTKTTSKPGPPACPGKSIAETYLRLMRCPVCRRRDSHSGFRRELENLGGDAKGKGPSGRPARPKVPRRPLRGGPLRSSGEAGQCLWSEGGGSPVSRLVWSTGNRRNRRVSTERVARAGYAERLTSGSVRGSG
jgi:hypothetical protein